MQLPLLVRTALLSCAALACAGLSADVIQTSDGSRIVGKITKIDSGSVYVTTTYAGDIVIKQKEVTSLTTDSPISLRLDSGTRMTGQVATEQSGAVRVTNPEGAVTTSMDQVAAAWTPGTMDPQLAALQRHWAYEASADINGTTGNSNQLGTQGSLTAKLVTPTDELDLYTAYNRQVTNGEQSADQFKAGVDYSNHFDTRTSWFVKDEAGFDRVMDERFYETAAAGIGYDLIKTTPETLTFRGGLAYRYDQYYNPATPTVDSPAADFELEHDYKTETWELHNDLTFVPAFNDFHDQMATQDSWFQIPLKDPRWKLRSGVSNEYNSEPGPGIKKLDTTYFTQLILDFD